MSSQTQLQINNSNGCTELVIHNEDHTLMNSLRSLLVKNENVKFAGYRIIHPLENKVQMYISTKENSEKSNIESLLAATHDLQNNIKTFETHFDKAVQAHSQITA